MAEAKELFSLDDSLTTVQDSWSSLPAGLTLLIEDSPTEYTLLIDDTFSLLIE